MTGLRAVSLFRLCRVRVKSFAENFMVRLNVKDLDAWWQVGSRKQFEIP